MNRQIPWCFGRALNQELNRTLKSAELSWRQRLTGLTTWITRMSRESERFALGRFALICGSAFAGWTATLTQRITGRWDAQLSGGRDRLSYQAANVADKRRDFMGRFGGGIGYAVRDQVRAGLNVTYGY